MEKEEKVRYLIAALLSTLLINSKLFIQYTYNKNLAIDKNLGAGSPTMNLIQLIVLILLGLVLLLIALDFLVAGVVPDAIINIITWIYFLVLSVLVIVFAILNYLML